MSSLYTFDDPRLLYDELCFYYDGGYDLVCINENAVRKIYGRTGFVQYTDEREEEKKEIFNVFIKASLYSINGKVVDEEVDEKVYRYTNEPDLIKIDISDVGVSIDMTRPLFTSDYIGISRNSPTTVDAVLMPSVNKSDSEIKIVNVDTETNGKADNINFVVSLFKPNK